MNYYVYIFYERHASTLRIIIESTTILSDKVNVAAQNESVVSGLFKTVEVCPHRSRTISHYSNRHMYDPIHVQNPMTDNQ